jgi:hypothetical protein
VNRFCTVESDDMALTAPRATRTLALNGLTITATLSRNAVTLARKCRESCNSGAPTPSGKGHSHKLFSVVEEYTNFHSSPVGA